MARQTLTLILTEFSAIVANPINQSLLPQSLRKLIKRGQFITSEDKLMQRLIALFSKETMRCDDFPMASLRGGTSFSLCVDPCYLQADRDQLLLFHRGLTLKPTEAEQLIDTIAYLFDDLGASLTMHSPNQWLLTMPIKPEVEFIGLDRVDHHAVAEFLPRGADAGLWIRLWNEIQMALFDCPVNQTREAEGKVPINSVWFWGKGAMPTEWQAWSHVSGQDEILASLSDHSGSTWRDDIRDFSDIQANQSLHLVNFDSDKDWASQLGALDKNWFTPIYKALKRFQLDSINIIIPGWGHYQLTAASVWKIWL